jgi:hypothetical protein
VPKRDRLSAVMQDCIWMSTVRRVFAANLAAQVMACWLHLDKVRSFERSLFRTASRRDWSDGIRVEVTSKEPIARIQPEPPPGAESQPLMDHRRPNFPSKKYLTVIPSAARNPPSI